MRYHGTSFELFSGEPCASAVMTSSDFDIPKIAPERQARL